MLITTGAPAQRRQARAQRAAARRGSSSSACACSAASGAGEPASRARICASVSFDGGADAARSSASWTSPTTSSASERQASRRDRHALGRHRRKGSQMRAVQTTSIAPRRAISSGTSEPGRVEHPANGAEPSASHSSSRAEATFCAAPVSKSRASMAESTSVALAAAPIPSSADIARAEKLVRERFLHEGEDPAQSRSRPARPAGARSTWRSPSSRRTPRRKHPSTAWRREFSLLLGLERLLSEEEPKLADGTVLSAHQVDALSGTLTALLAEAQRTAPAATAAPPRRPRPSCSPRPHPRARRAGAAPTAAAEAPPRRGDEARRGGRGRGGADEDEDEDDEDDDEDLGPVAARRSRRGRGRGRARGRASTTVELDEDEEASRGARAAERGRGGAARLGRGGRGRGVRSPSSPRTPTRPSASGSSTPPAPARPSPRSASSRPRRRAAC